MLRFVFFISLYASIPDVGAKYAIKGGQDLFVFDRSAKDPIEAICQSYFGLKNALVRDDVDSASYFAGKLIDAMKLLETSDPASSKKDSWMKQKKNLNDNATGIKDSKEVEKQRQYFMKLSNAMYVVIKDFHSNTNTIYYQFCPMANKGKGAYWVSENPKIMNPYYGKKMLHCGSTKEEIKPQ
jgi:hypothetical protein